MHRHYEVSTETLCVVCSGLPWYLRELFALYERLEDQMTDLSQAQQDLAAAVSQAVDTINSLETQVTQLKAAQAAGDSVTAAAVADAIEAQVATLKGAFPAPAADATPAAPADTPAPADAAPAAATTEAPATDAAPADAPASDATATPSTDATTTDPAPSA